MENGLKRLALIFSIIIGGASAIVSQIIFMREFFNVFYGNEIVFAIILSNWFLINGIGGYCGKLAKKIKEKIRLLIFLQMVTSFSLITALTLIRSTRILIIPYGVSADPLLILVYTFLVLFPFCFASGFIFPLACSIFSEVHHKQQIGKVYFLDNIGSIAGSFIFSFILVFIFNSYQITFLIFFLNIFSVYFLSESCKYNKIKIFALFLTIFSLILFFTFDFENTTISLLFPNQKIIHHRNSIYGHIVITESEGQFNFFENSLPLFSTDNAQESEEIVHYSMVQHPNPKKVLLISGGVAGRIKELSKYDVIVDYVELDSLIIELGKKYTENLEYDKLRIFLSDGRFFLKTSRDKYDVIIVDLPEPSTAQLNRFYTLEFFKEVKKSLKSNGIFSFKLPFSPNYISYESMQLNSIIFNTISSVFKNVIIIPSGGKNYFIASDVELSYNISELIKLKNIQTFYVNENYLKGELTEERIESVKASVYKPNKINTDFCPIAYYYHTLYWQKQFEENILFMIILIIAIIIFFSIFVIKISRIHFAIATTGFAASSFEFMLILGFQIIYGYVYHYVSIIIGFFMLGLAFGSYYANKTLKARKLMDMVKIQFSILLFSLIVPVILIFVSYLQNEFILNISLLFIFPGLTFIIAFLVGMEFPIASKLCSKVEHIENAAGKLYTSDLLGASIGSLITATFLIPILGFLLTCIVIGLVNLLSGIMLTKKLCV